MYKDLIQIIDKNLRYLKSCLDLTEAHITWGNKSIKEKYSKIKKDILNKMKEEKVYKKLYTELLNTPIIEEEPTPYIFTPKPSRFNIINSLSLY